MKNRGMYISWGYVAIMLITLVITYFLLELILQPLFHNPNWVITGTYVFWIVIMIFTLYRLMPILLIIKDDEVLFIGIPWIYRFNRSMLDEVIVECCGILFKPKKEYEKKFRWVPKYPSEPYSGYRVINFLNYKAVGVLFEVMKPITGEHIAWDKLNPKWRKYLEEKLYGSGNE